MKRNGDMRPPAESFLSVLIVAAVVGFLFSGLGLVVNALRADGIDLVAKRDYDILVPCPEPLGEVFPLDPGEIGQDGALIVDARETEDFAAWHWPEATSIPFDFLDPVPKETVAELIRTRARLIAVYGDGDDPDSGRELARELAGRGARNVYFVTGGAPALQQATGGRHE